MSGAAASASCENSIVYHMEKKYLCDQHVESFIDMFGTSPCKVANERGLELLVLDRKNITNVGDVERFASFVQNVSELDLAWNQISSWSTVSTLLRTMPSLKMLNLSHNPIDKSPPLIEDDLENKMITSQIVDDDDEDGENSQCSSHTPPASVFTSPSIIPVTNKLTTLILNGVGLPLGTVRRFVSAMPNLNELHISENEFGAEIDRFYEEECTGDDVPIFSTSVSALDLNACGLCRWRAVLRFVRLFPRTQHLLVADNRLEHVDEETEDGLTTEQVCESVKCLSLSANKLKTWRSIENLALIGRLQELRVRNVTPLFNEHTEEERHHLIVARLRSLVLLNGSNITPALREESERFFIRYYQNADEQPAIYAQLVAEHGHIEQLVKVDLTPRRFAKVVLRCEETNYLATARIRLNGTVIELMRYAAKITGIAPQRMRLFHVDVGGPKELRFPNKVLQSLHIDDGDEFFIQSKIVTQKQRPHCH